MNNYTFQLAPGAKTRHNAGSYDPNLYLPKYEIEVMTPDDFVRSKVQVNQVLMGTKGSHFLVFDIQNNSTWPVFIQVKKDGVLVEQ